jgi:hypothetical protein
MTAPAQNPSIVPRFAPSRSVSSTIHEQEDVPPGKPLSHGVKKELETLGVRSRNDQIAAKSIL